MQFILVGGFLGSGKTTAVVNASQELMRQKRQVAVITNDQGNQQVDAAFVRSLGITTRQVGNGCFCCRYDELSAHVQNLESIQPDTIFAESVGSCTDLVATVAKPMAKFFPGLRIMLTIFVDTSLLSSLLEGTSNLLDESVQYIFKKQMEEADVLIFNKIDLLTKSQLANIKEFVKKEFADKIMLYQNSLLDESCSAWLAIANTFDEQGTRSSLTMDYDVYGAGESKLAWLDQELTLEAPYGDGLIIVGKMIQNIVAQLRSHEIVIGHLKFLIESPKGVRKVSFTAASTDGTIRLGHDHTTHVKMLINARVQTSPVKLQQLIDDVLHQTRRTFHCELRIGSQAAFQPGYPTPTHRIN